MELYILGKNKISKSIPIIISFIIAGGISNLIDRIFRGAVIDFIDITPIINFPVFNLADIMIVIGVAIFMIEMIKNIIKNEGKEKG